MNTFAHNNPRLRRTFSLVALGAVLAVSAVTLSQCRFSGDSLTGVDLNASRGSVHSECVQACQDKYKASREAEQERHRKALLGCGTDILCKQAEDKLFVDNLKAIEGSMQDCKRGCYNEGSGNGGGQ